MADKIFISRHTSYPIKVDAGKDNQLILVQEEDLLKHYDQIFNAKFKKMILSQTIDSVDVSAHLIFLRNGQILFNYIVDKEGNDKISIYGIFH